MEVGAGGRKCLLFEAEGLYCALFTSLLFYSLSPKEVPTVGRRKRNSRVLEQANERLNGLKSISPTLELGEGLSVAGLEVATNALRSKLDAYNQKLSELDEDLFELEAEERKLKELNGRMLAGVAARFGRNSSQYEQAGGVRTSDRKRSSRKNGGGTPPKQT